MAGSKLGGKRRPSLPRLKSVTSKELAPVLPEDAFVRASDRDVLEIYERRAGQLWAFGRRLGLTADEAEEAVQEAFARLVAGRRDVIREPDAWLFRAVHNLAMDQHRRTKRVRLIEVDVGERGRARVAAGQDDPERAVDLWAAVDRLPERQRAVIYLRYRAGFDYASIARILSISSIGARANAFRALARLRGEMGE